MLDLEARSIVDLYSHLKGQRGLLESHWQQIAEIVRPFRADFYDQAKIEQGYKRHEKIFDATPMLAADQLAAGIWSSMSSSASDWSAVEHVDEEIQRDYEVSMFTDTVTSQLRSDFSANGGAFYAEILECFMDGVSFGTTCMFMDEVKGRWNGCRFRYIPINDMFLMEDDLGVISGTVRRFHMSAYSAVTKWGERAPRQAKLDVKQNQPNNRHEYIHAVLPNDLYDPRRLDVRGKKFKSRYIAVENSEMMQTGGYFENPYICARWGVSSTGPYGTSPAMHALPDSRMLQQMSKTSLIAAQRFADPPVGAPDKSKIRGVFLKPGGVIYGAVDDQGRRLVQTIDNQAGSLSLTIEHIRERQQAVRDAFLSSLLLLSTDTNMTATEVLERKNAQLKTLAPNLARITAELLDPIHDRAFAMRQRAGALPPIPDLVAQEPNLRVAYRSPLARLQQQEDALGIVSGMQSIAEMAQTVPTVVDNFDWDEAVKTVGRGFGFPSRLLKDKKAVAADREARQPQEQAAQLAQLAPAAKDGAMAMNEFSKVGMDQPAANVQPI